MLHQEIGENYLNVVVIPEIEGVLRQTIGKLKTEEVYTTNPHLLDTFNKIIDLELSRKTKSHHHIIYEEVIIKNITLPTAYRNAIENKLKQKQFLEEYQFKLLRAKKEKQRKIIEAEGINLYQNIISKSLTEKLLQWQGINSTVKLSESNNSKIVVIGRAKDGLPLILDTGKDKDSNK